MLSEFNIDQIALTTRKRKKLVKSKFELAIETQQRVVKSNKASNKDTMDHLAQLAAILVTALNTTKNNCENTTALSELYKMPDILSQEYSYPEDDVDYAKQRIAQIKEFHKSIKYNFWGTRKHLDQLIANLMWYEDGYSAAIDQIETCRNIHNLNGDENVRDQCEPRRGPPPIPDCTLELRYLCFVNNHPLFVEFYVFKNPPRKIFESVARHELTNLEDYNRAVNWTFAGQTLDPTEYTDHHECQRNLDKYENTVLPNLTDFLSYLEDLSDVSNLTETEELFWDFESIIDTDLGPYLLVNDSEKMWTLPEEVGGFREQENYETERLKCSWYSEIYHNEIKDFDRHVSTVHSKISQTHRNIRRNFENIVRLLEKLSEHYDEELAEAFQKVKDYMDGTVTKKELAELLSGRVFNRAIIKLNTMNSNLISAVKNFDTSYRKFPNLLISFYESMTEKTFPFLTHQTKDDYPFLQQMMSWYRNLGGKELLEQHLQVYGELHGVELPANTAFTESNIWLALEKAVEGFNEDAINTGLQAFVSTITEKITNPVKDLITRLDKMVIEMTGYKKKIKMNTNFYM